MRKRNVLLLLLSGLLLVAGCAPSPVRKQVITDDGGNVSSLVQLSKERVAEIRKAFIGRSFVFKEDWYEYSIIDSDPLGGFSDPAPITTFPTWLEGRNYRVQVASTGSVAKITGARMYRNGINFICDVEGADKAYLIIINHRPWTLLFGSRNMGEKVQRDAMKDKRITVDWINRNLTLHTVEWLDGLPEVPADDLALPEPAAQPTLTPVPVGGSGFSTASAPAIGWLNIQASPAVVRQNQTLNLRLEYSLEGVKQKSVQVVESRTLLFNGRVLPGYPKTTTSSRKAGQFSTDFQQRIPPQAKTGSYLYRGEVCVADDCVSRSKKFTVTP